MTLSYLLVLTGARATVRFWACLHNTMESCTVSLFPFLVFQDIIYKLKTAFNKEFDRVVRQKEQEIARVKERNLRIQEILAQLELQVELWEPALTDDEMPERALTVQDAEVSEKEIFLFHTLRYSSLILLISRPCVSTEKP